MMRDLILEHHLNGMDQCSTNHEGSIQQVSCHHCKGKNTPYLQYAYHHSCLHSMHDCTHQYNTGEQRISTVPACIKSIPHPSLLDDNSSCIIGKYGEALKAVHQVDDQNTSTFNLSLMEAFSSDSTIVST